jgi:hypothetical protein
MTLKMMFSPPSRSVLLAGLAAVLTCASGNAASAQRRDDSYRPPAEQNSGWQAPAEADYGRQSVPSTQGNGGQGAGGQGYGQPQSSGPSQSYGSGQPSRQAQPYTPPPAYGQQPSNGQPYGGPSTSGQNQGYAANGYGAGPRQDDSYRGPPRQEGYGETYSAPRDQPPPERYDRGDSHPTRGYYSQGEITEKGRGFFGSITQGLASAIEYTYQKAGRPNGYILGEDGGGAFFAGLRYGEGMLFTKDAGDHKVFWQGPSIGYDVGGEGSKIMVLVYNMADPGDIFHRFGGVEGSVYVIGGVSVQFQKHDDVNLAVIRSGVGLRLGANVGYLKYTRQPTWNPF